MSTCSNDQCDRPARSRGLCHACYMRYLERQHAYGRFESVYVDAEPIREHVVDLLEAGLSRRRIAELAGLNRKSLNWLLNGRSERGTGPAKRITRTNADKFLAVKIPETIAAIAPDAALVDSIGSIRRLRALVAFGWPVEHLADELQGEVGRCTVHELVRGGRTQCLARTARSISGLFNRLQLEPGPSPRSRSTALKRRWALPLQWDEESIDDPKALPEQVRYSEPKARRRGSFDSRELRIERVRELTRAKLSASQIAQQLDIPQRQVVRDRAS